MTDKPPKALRLAQCLEEVGRLWEDEAAVELRRLHEENESLKRAIRLSGLSMVKTVNGLELMKLSEMKAQGERND